MHDKKIYQSHLALSELFYATPFNQLLCEKPPIGYAVKHLNSEQLLNYREIVLSKPEKYVFIVLNEFVFKCMQNQF